MCGVATIFVRFNIDESGWQVELYSCAKSYINETYLYWGAVSACVGQSSALWGIGSGSGGRELFLERCDEGGGLLPLLVASLLSRLCFQLFEVESLSV